MGCMHDIKMLMRWVPFANLARMLNLSYASERDRQWLSSVFTLVSAHRCRRGEKSLSVMFWLCFWHKLGRESFGRRALWGRELTCECESFVMETASISALCEEMGGVHGFPTWSEDLWPDKIPPSPDDIEEEGSIVVHVYLGPTMSYHADWEKNSKMIHSLANH